jgi:hypothetical protein
MLWPSYARMGHPLFSFVLELDIESVKVHTCSFESSNVFCFVLENENALNEKNGWGW